MQHPQTPPIPEKFSSSSFRRFQRAFLSPSYLRRRGFLIILILSLLSLCEAGIIYRLLLRPQKQYPIVLSQSVSGQVQAIHTDVFQPSDANTAYFIRLWVSRLLSVDIRRFRQDLSQAGSWVRGQAIEDLYHFIKTDASGKNLANNKMYSRSIVFHSLVLGGKSTSRYADLTLAMIVVQQGHVTKKTEKMVHIDFFLLPPSREKDVRDNPIGLFITHFSVAPASPSGLSIVNHVMGG